MDKKQWVFRQKPNRFTPEEKERCDRLFDRFRAFFESVERYIIYMEKFGYILLLYDGRYMEKDGIPHYADVEFEQWGEHMGCCEDVRRVLTKEYAFIRIDQMIQSDDEQSAELEKIIFEHNDSELLDVLPETERTIIQAELDELFRNF